MTTTPPSIIAIDGPAASGKSTLGLSLAQALGYLFFDTGIMYRAITWLALRLDIDLNDRYRASLKGGWTRERHPDRRLGCYVGNTSA